MSRKRKEKQKRREQRRRAAARSDGGRQRASTKPSIEQAPKEPKRKDGRGAARPAAAKVGGTSAERAQFSSCDEVERILAEIQGRHRSGRNAVPAPASRATELDYEIDLSAARAETQLVLRVTERRRERSSWDAPRPFDQTVFARQRTYDDDLDRKIADVLPGGRRAMWYEAPKGSERGRFALDRALCEAALPLLARSPRCVVRLGAGETVPIELDEGEPWQLEARVTRDEARGQCLLEGFFVRGEERVELARLALVLSAGLFFQRGRIARFDARGADRWAVACWREGARVVPLGEEAALFDELGRIAGRPLIQLEAAVELAPTPRLFIEATRDGEALPCRLAFDYDGVEVEPGDPRRVLFDVERRRACKRREEDEAAARALLIASGAVARPLASGVERLERVINVERSERAIRTERSERAIRTERFELEPAALPAAVRKLLAAGWIVEASGRRVRAATHSSFKISSGRDWFELSGGIDFDEVHAPVAGLATLARRRELFVRLGDGSLGVLPEEWLARWGLAALGGEREGDALRFGNAQALWLDTLLPREEFDADARFATLRKELAGFSQLEPRNEPRGFGGTLRDYQRLALGWLALLRRFGLGGCLADDMGLGKTIVVLAALEERRRAKKAERAPSLVVVPRSLVTNWTREAQRFAPKLVLRRYTGSERAAELEALAPGEVLVTTYGTLRRDAEQLSRLEFDLVVLDEAQAIKNAASQTARAARTLRGRQRLALSGTPVENHLGELGSLLGFLDPALARRKWALELLDPRLGEDRSGERARLLAALRPLFLRRTKEEVLPELPEKSEQILWCELGAAQRRVYDDLRLELRRELLAGGDERGWKLSALEALLRLRQAACHPALIDETLAEAGSAKLEQLVLHLEEIRASGHKALIFSQFTSFLAKVRAALEERELTYEYLDGRTRNRAQCVERFQTDPACPFFLVSLKAGGVGLNLTAADYVFLLDPWWNPAVETQAIDRAHRMGRTEKVLAYRMIARDTIEEKVLELQAEKRELVRSILGEGGTLLRQLTREDLEALLA